jgi:hypothetical protein
MNLAATSLSALFSFCEWRGHLTILWKVARFYADGVGFKKLGCFHDHEGFDGVKLGVPGASYHVELRELVVALRVVHQLRVVRWSSINLTSRNGGRLSNR